MAMGELRKLLVVFLVLTAITGILYPLGVTMLAQLFFPYRANGSLISSGGRILGSELIGQAFTGPGYFWARPSATASGPYNALASSGSNLGPLNPGLLADVQNRIRLVEDADPLHSTPVPVDLVTASGSGLDPHISVMAALYQVPRVARARHLSEEKVRVLVEHNIEGRQLGFLGEPRVNVFRLNIALDEADTATVRR